MMVELRIWRRKDLKRSSRCLLGCLQWEPVSYEENTIVRIVKLVRMRYYQTWKGWAWSAMV